MFTERLKHALRSQQVLLRSLSERGHIHSGILSAKLRFPGGVRPTGCAEVVVMKTSSAVQRSAWDRFSKRVDKTGGEGRAYVRGRIVRSRSIDMNKDFLSLHKELEQPFPVRVIDR